MLYREPMWLKSRQQLALVAAGRVSVLYREPMWLKSHLRIVVVAADDGFSALP